MVINGVWRNKVRMMRENGDNESAKRELRKAKMSKAYQETSDKNRIFVDYCLALHSKEENDMLLTNMYISEIEKIFLNDSSKIKDLNPEYCKCLWLKTNINSKTLTLKQITSNMMYIYDYYYLIGEYDVAISALANIYSLKGDGEKLLEKFEEFLNCTQISNPKFIDDFLKDCDKLSHNLYIEAIEVLNRYYEKNKENIV